MKKSLSCHYLFFIGFLLLSPALAYGQSDIFEVRTPNVMIIFDTSSSMEMSVNIDTKGNSIWTTQKGPDKSTPYRQDGNHPDSKLYQAKKALSQIINEVVQDKVNMGFSTYAQEKIETRRAQYKQDVSISEGWRRYKRYYVWGTTNDSTRTATSIYSDSFIDAWNITRSSVTVGTTFDRGIYIHNKGGPLHPQYCTSGADCIGNFKATSTYTITYKVTARSYNPETNVYTFTYGPTTPAYDYYWESYFYDSWSSSKPSCGSDKMGNPWPKNQSGSGMTWSTHFSDDSPSTEYDTPSNGRTAKWWNCYNDSYRSASSTPNYTWSNTTGTSCDATKSGTPIWNIVPGTCFDWSGYKYTPEGTTDRPHTWSYFEKDGKGNWPIGKPSPYYPAPKGDPGQNDNHYFFINFPDDKDSGFKASDRTDIKKTILSFLDLTPVKRPDVSAPGEYWTKLPIHAIQGLKGLTGNVDPLNPFAFNTQRVTPLADSLNSAFTYFYDYINKYNGGDPSSKQKFGDTVCRGNYIVLLTDGLESCRLDGDGNPIYKAAPDEAANLYALNVQTFVIGFGGDIKGNKALNDIAVAGGTGKAYFAANFDELKKALGLIFQTITGQNYGRSNPVVSSTRDRIYRGYFNLPGYKGHLVAFDLNTNDGSIKGQAWDAGDIMNTNGRGDVYTWDDDKFEPDRVNFKVNKALELKDLLNPSPEQDIDWDSIKHIIGDGKINKEDAETIINFVLDASYGQYQAGGLWAPFPYQGQRSVIANPPYPSDPPVCWKLGDIYHSTPLVVGTPPLNIPDEQFPKKYSDFKTTWKDRETVIYVGANDGMLHAFNNDGKEKFSIIPRDLLGKLRDIRNDHNFYVDSSPRAYDVYFKKGKGKDKWITVLMSGERGGGNYYFAIDITDPDNPDIIWENTDSGMGNTWSRPEIGRVKINGQEKFVAFVGGGYSTTDSVGNTFYIIDVEDGTILKNFVVGDKSNKVPAGATAFDNDLDGRIDAVYFGDIQGTLWKIKIGGDKLDDWNLIKLFTSDGGNPIFYPPAVTKNNQGKVLVYFGQGDELNLFENVKTYYFYEIWDKGDSGEKVWKTEGTTQLSAGEKVLATPAVGNNVVYFTTWQYTGENNCGAGVGRLYGLTSTTAGAQGGLAALFYDISGKKLENPVKYIDIGIGIPSAPIVIPGRVYISTSLNANIIISIPIPSWGKGKLKYWREVF